MKDPNKKECMKKIFNVGFDLMKTKLMSLGLTELMEAQVKAKAAQVKAELEASGSEMFKNFSVGSKIGSVGSKIGSLGSSLLGTNKSSF